MRIGIITGEYPPDQGGVGAYTRVFARHLAQAGHPVSIFTSSRADADDLAAEGVRITPVAHRWRLSALRAIREWAHAEQLDVINLQYQTAAFGMSPFIHFIPDMLTIPTVTTFHDLRVPYLFPKAGALRPWTVRHMARASAGAIVTNDEDAAVLAPLNLRHLATIPIGSNILASLPPEVNVNTIRAQAGAQSGDFLIANFGLINSSKGIDTLINALERMRSGGVPARLALIGAVAGSSDPTNTAYLQAIDGQIERSGLKPFVHKTDYLADEMAAAWLTAADVIALPFTDGASARRGSLMAALHYGAPIVTTTPHVPIPAFVDSVNMRLVPAGDPDALAAALHQLYADSVQRDRLGAGARSLAARFAWPTIAAAAADFFARVIDDHGKPHP